MPSPEKFLETLQEFNVDKEIIDAIYDGYDNIVTKTKKPCVFKYKIKEINTKKQLNLFDDITLVISFFLTKFDKNIFIC